MSDHSNRIYELRQSAIQAALNYEVWWVFKSSDTRPKYTEIMNRYPLYFHAAINAHFMGLLLPLYRLFETRKDTHNIPGLLHLLRSEGALEESKLDEFDAHYERLKSTWIKIARLRNEVFGHRSLKKEISESFAKAQITPNQIRDLIYDTQELLNCISSECESSYHAFNADPEDDTLQLLKDLKSYHELIEQHENDA